MQEAAVRAPEWQLVGPDTVKPGLHVGWHFEPDCKLAEQSPTAPLEGGADASHAAAQCMSATWYTMHSFASAVQPELTM